MAFVIDGLPLQAFEHRLLIVVTSPSESLSDYVFTRTLCWHCDTMRWKLDARIETEGYWMGPASYRIHTFYVCEVDIPESRALKPLAPRIGEVGYIRNEERPIHQKEWLTIDPNIPGISRVSKRVSYY